MINLHFFIGFHSRQELFQDASERKKRCFLWLFREKTVHLCFRT